MNEEHDNSNNDSNGKKKIINNKQQQQQQQDEHGRQLRPKKVCNACVWHKSKLDNFGKGKQESEKNDKRKVD